MRFEKPSENLSLVCAARMTNHASHATSPQDPAQADENEAKTTEGR